MKIKLKSLLCVLIIFLLCLPYLTGCAVLDTDLWNDTKIEEGYDDNLEIGNQRIHEFEERISDDNIGTHEKQYTFALFGIDSYRDTNIIGESSCNNTIILVTVNQQLNQIRLISVLCGSEVNVPGYGRQKINTAYAYGGQELALNTINANFDLDIQDYITVDFCRFGKIIDILGGIDVVLNEDEAALIPATEDGVKPIVGKNHLNGNQAVEYTRIYSIDSNVTSVPRQQTVLQEVLLNITALNLRDCVPLVLQIIDCVETSLPFSTILSILLTSNTSTMIIETYTVPSEKIDPNLCVHVDETGQWVWKFDIEKTSKFIKETLAFQQ